MWQAGEEVLECRRVLQKADLNVVGEVLRGQGTFYEHEHYPSEDVLDSETASQYYYHAHRGYPGEHGHFHTFLRAAGMPEKVRPAPYKAREQWPTGKQAIAHLIAVSMDAYGEPIALFAVNRWVTGDTWYSATDVARMLPRFRIDHARPSWPVNRWLSALLRLYRPHIEALLAQRDQVLEAWRRAHPESDVYEDRRLDVTGWLPISVQAHVAKLGQLIALSGAYGKERLT